MSEAAIGLIITSAGIFAVFAGLFIWGLVSGQFRNVEESKYRIFEAEDAHEEKKGEESHA